MTIQNLIALAAALDGAVAAVTILALARRRGRLDVAAIAGGVAALLAATVLSVAALVPAGLRAFGLVRLVFLLAAVTVPSLGVVLLLSAVAGRRSGRRASRAAIALGVAALMPAGPGYWAACVEPARLVTERATVTLDPAREGRAPIRIGVLSDLQAERIGDHEREAFRRVVAAAPDLVLLPGDLFQASDDEFEEARPALRALIATLRAPGGAWFVDGDIDQPHQTRAALRDGPVRILEDEVVVVTVSDRRVAIGGARDAAGSAPFLKAFATRPDPGEVRILLVHRPDAVLRLPEHGRIDLVVCGHTHGGQVRIPFFGPPLTLSRVPRDVAAGGLHEFRGYPLYVSRGIGVERGQAPRIRFLCPPEVSLITLR